MQWRVERFSRGVTHGVDKWQAPARRILQEQNPAYRDTVFLFLKANNSRASVSNPTAIMSKIESLIQFLTVDIWRMRRDERTEKHGVWIAVFKKIYLAVQFFIDKGVMAAASALTYSTLLAIVPIVAVVFAIARGFGFNKYIEEWFLNMLSSQPQAAEAIVGFVNSYLVHTHSGVILGIGLLFMLWTVLMLVHNIELTFNQIWQVKQQRSWSRKITDYLSFFFLAPIAIVLTSGVTIFLSTVAKQMEGYMLLGSAVRFFIGLMPYVIMSALFITLYVFIPNTHVKLKNAIVPGILAGVAMQLLQYFYIHCQIFLSGYNAIYGSFAALPLFMLWVQLSWTICLFGAELTYTSQNLEEFAFRAEPDDISHRYQLLLSAILLSRICQREDNEQGPATAFQLKMETDIPTRIVSDLLYKMTQAGILRQSYPSLKAEEAVYTALMPIDKLTIGTLVDRLEAQGRWEIELPLKELCQGPYWKQAIGIRHDYLQHLRQVNIRDLSLAVEKELPLTSSSQKTAITSL